VKTTLHGEVRAPVAAVVGVWDPLLPAHRDLFADLRRHASAHDLAAVAIVLDPSPQALLYGAADAPVYHDLRTRIAILLAAGLDAVLTVHLAERDLLAGAEAFFDRVGRRHDLRELWLGARQTLGRGEVGSVRVIERTAADRGVALTRLPDRRLPTGTVQRLLAEGRLDEAAQLVGGSPIQSRPRGESLTLAWSPGSYRAVPLRDPTAPIAAPALTIDAIPTGAGLVRIPWPSRDIPALAFLRGPGDLAARDDRARHPVSAPAAVLVATP
jgi:hypothetical protein